MFGFCVVAANPGVISCYDPREKMLVLPDFIHQFLGHKHPNASLRWQAIEAQTSWSSLECCKFPLKICWHDPYERPNLPAISEIVLRRASLTTVRNFLQDLFSVWPVEERSECGNASYRMSVKRKDSKVCFIPMALWPKAVLSISFVPMQFSRVWSKT